MDAKAVGITALYQEDGLSLQVFSLEVHQVMAQLLFAAALKLLTELCFLLEPSLIKFICLLEEVF